MKFHTIRYIRNVYTNTNNMYFKPCHIWNRVCMIILNALQSRKINREESRKINREDSIDLASGSNDFIFEHFRWNFHENLKGQVPNPTSVRSIRVLDKGMDDQDDEELSVNSSMIVGLSKIKLTIIVKSFLVKCVSLNAAFESLRSLSWSWFKIDFYCRIFFCEFFDRALLEIEFDNVMLWYGKLLNLFFLCFGMIFELVKKNGSAIKRSLIDCSCD